MITFDRPIFYISEKLPSQTKLTIVPFFEVFCPSRVPKPPSVADRTFPPIVRWLFRRMDADFAFHPLGVIRRFYGNISPLRLDNCFFLDDEDTQLAVPPL